MVKDRTILIQNYRNKAKAFEDLGFRSKCNESTSTLEIVFTIAAPAFDILYIGCVLNTKIAYANAEKLTS